MQNEQYKLPLAESPAIISGPCYSIITLACLLDGERGRVKKAKKADFAR